MSDTRSAVIPWWVFAAITAVGVILLAAGGFWTTGVNKFLTTAIEAPGQIIDFDSYQDDDGQTMYQPVVSFTTEDGRELEFTGATGTSWRPEVGRQVTVLYDPDNPADASLQGFASLWLGPVILLVLGSLFAVLGLALWFFLRGRPVPVSDSGVDFMTDD